MSEGANKIFRVGDWLVEADLNRLSRDSESLLLEPKTMEVLVYLCGRPGEVVSADEMIDAIWQGRPMGDNPVYKSVAKLRRALGDDAGKPRYIATVAKKGYRLLASVELVTAAATPRQSRRKSDSPLRQYLPVVAAMFVGVALAAALFWRPEPAPLSLQSVSGFSGSHRQPTFAPDGRSIAFISDTAGGSHVWVLDLADQAPRQLTSGNNWDSRPRWSPDGTAIIFMRRGSIWSVDSAGSEAREILSHAYNPNWSRDGRRIVFERRYGVWIANADGGEQIRVSGVPRKELPLAPRWPAFSPKGDEIVYLDADATPFADLWRVPVAGGTPTQLTFAPAFSSAPVWSPDGRYILYSSLRGGSRTLWKVSVKDGVSRPILTGSGDDDFPDISADGSRLIYSNRRERFSIVLSDPESGEHRMLHESRQMVLAPELSPDRSDIAFFSVALTGGVQLFTLPLSGGTPTKVTNDPLATHAIPRWSADGTQLYTYLTHETSAFARVASGGGDAEVVVPGWDWTVSNGASVSPDGKRVIYSRLTGQVPVQTLIRDLKTGSDTAFYATLEYPRWSRNGDRIIGAMHNDQSFPGDIAECPVAGSECLIIARDARIPMYSATESEIYFVRGMGSSQELFVAPINSLGGEQHLLTMAPLFPLGPFYDVTLDGDIVWVRFEEEPSEIWLAELSD